MSANKLLRSRRRGLCIAVAVALGLVMTSLPRPAAAQVPLPIPFIGQGYCYTWCSNPGWNGHNNCGPASLAMLAQANGQRPDDLSNREFVSRARRVMTGSLDGCANPGTNRRHLDAGAKAFGLCDRGEAWSLAAIKAHTDKCLPVIAFVDPGRLPMRNPGWFGRLDHILVITGVDDHFTYVNDPLDFRGVCSPSLCDPNAVCGGPDRHGNIRMRDALYYAAYGWWGKAYGEPIGNCDTPRCSGGGGSGGGAVVTGVPLDLVRVRTSSDCPGKYVQLYWEADTDYGFHEARSAKAWLRTGWQTITFDLRRKEDWRRSLRKLRFDAPQGDTGCNVGISFIWVTNASNDAEHLWWFSKAAPERNGCPLLDWQCRGLLDRFLPGSWILQTTSTDPWVEITGLNIDLRR